MVRLSQAFLPQYLIACSMQVWRGKAWEIWSRVVASGRQTTDTQGAVANKLSQALLAMSI